MFNWLKKLFGVTEKKQDNTFPFPTAKVQDQSNLAPYKVESPASESKTVKAPKPKAAKKTAPKITAKKSKTADLDSMNKTELLAEAKKRGIKANASLKKDEVLERIKNG